MTRTGLIPVNHLILWKNEGKNTALTRCTGNLLTPAMPFGDVFCDSEAQSGAANFARAVRIDAVKPLGQPGEVVRFNPFALIGYVDTLDRARQAGIG